MIPAGEVLRKEGYEEQGKQLSEFATEVPAIDYSDGIEKIDPIVHALKIGNQKESCVEKLVNAAHCTLVKPYGFILENSGTCVTISQLINYFGINTTASVRCSKCFEVFTWDEILFHLGDSYKKGHNMKLKDITKLFQDEWYNWRWYNGKFIK